MTSEVYGSSPIRRHRSTKAELEALDDVIVQVVADENPVTLRGVYYRCVSKGAITKTEAEYKRVGVRLAKLREAGRIPWDWIEDGSRLTMRRRSYDSVTDALDETAAMYRRNLWRDSDAEVIIVSEKDAISGSVAQIVVDKWGCDLAIVRGYSSITFVHLMAQRILRNTQAGQVTFVYQLGDHDPSGLDAWRSFQENLHKYAPGGEMECSRLAVTPEQVAEFGLLTRPTKRSDARAKNFVGDSVEVDAIPAPKLRQIVDEAIAQHIDPHALEVAETYEESERLMIRGFALEAMAR